MKLTMMSALAATLLVATSDLRPSSMAHAAWRQGAPGAINLREPTLRRAASVSPMPEYPQGSLNSKTTGVAVAAVSISVDGRVEQVEILEAPDQEIAAAVRAAAIGWVVPWQSGPAGETAKPRTGKLTFYFRIVKGKGRVFNPEDMPGGPRPREQGRSGSRGGSPPPAAPAAAEAPSAKTITVADLEKLPAPARPIILDVGARDAFKRGHTPGAVNIPVDEVPVRAGIELAGARAVAIDCTRDEMWRCQAASAMLKQKGFTEAFILVR